MADYAIHDTTLAGISNVIRKKEGSSALIDPADYPKRINLMGMLEKKIIVSSPICDFSDGSDDVPTDFVKIAIPANLDGKSSVSEKHTGRNLLPDTNYMTNYFSVADNGVVSQITTGAPYAWAYANCIFKTTLPAGTYTAIEELVTDVTNSSHGVQVFNSSNNRITSVSGGLKTAGIYSSTFTLSEKTDIGIVCKLYDGTAKLYIVGGSASTAYEPYNGTTYSANLGRTVYGAEVDIANGDGQETHGKKVFDGTEGTGGTPSWTMISVSQGTMFRITVSDKATTSATNTLCSYYTPTAQSQRADGTVSGAGTNVDIIDNRFSSVDAFKAWLAENPVTLVYELATQTDFTFDGQEIDTMLGYNAFWSEDGDTSVAYRSSGTITSVVPTLISKTITENGTYSAEDDDADGYDEVTVNVPSQEVNVTPLSSTRVYLYPDGISGTNVERTVQTLTATGTGKYVFASDTATRTNTSSNDGFVGVKKNGTFIVQQNLNTNVKVPYTIPDIDVVAGDEVSIVVGFANYHTSCEFEIYTAIAFVEEVTS